MKLGAFFQAAVKFGKLADPRGARAAKGFADTAILYGSPQAEIRRILVGIDIEVAELLLADRIRSQDGLDLVVSHHPEGKAFSALHEVMAVQVDLLAKAGVSKRVAEELLRERMDEVARRIMSNNHMRPVDAARLLDLPFVCMHTVADNQVNAFVYNLLQQRRPKKVSQIIDMLLEIPEYKTAKIESLSGPKIILGNPNRPVGKIFMEMTGGTEGNKEVYDKLYKAGVRTLVSMHLGEEHFKKVKDANLNVVIAGHISSDNLGLNLLLDRIEKEAKEKFQVIDCSGFRRVKRN